jgi:hypothetical protein
MYTTRIKHGNQFQHQPTDGGRQTPFPFFLFLSKFSPLFSANPFNELDSLDSVYTRDFFFPLEDDSSNV